MGIVHPKDHVVAVQRVHLDYCVKIVRVDDCGTTIEPMTFASELPPHERPPVRVRRPRRAWGGRPRLRAAGAGFGSRGGPPIRAAPA
jgi:hypothetical protein